MIDDEPESVAEPPKPLEEAEPEPEVEAPKSKSPWKAFIITGVLAGLIGALVGGYGAYEGLKRFTPEPTPQAEIDFSPIESRLDNLADRLEAVETAIGEVDTLEIEPFDLSPLEARLEALETAPRPEIDPDALTALQAAQADGFDWPDISEFEARITALEQNYETPSDVALRTDLLDRITALEAETENIRNTEPVAVMDESVLSALGTRITALESRPEPKPVVERVSILAFPKAQLIEAVENNQKGGLIEKTLSRHIRVKDANDPLTLIDGIESDLLDGRLAAAAEKFERLPAPIRASGQAWYDSVKAAL